MNQILDNVIQYEKDNIETIFYHHSFVMIKK